MVTALMDELSVAVWREPVTRAFSCEHLPTNYSCDNAVLFTAEAYALGLIPKSEFDTIALSYEAEPGLLKRYPTSGFLMSWDDYVGAAAVSQLMAERVLRYAETHGWRFGGEDLGRFPIFAPILRSGAGYDLSLYDQLSASLAYLSNMTEPKQETSGKIILWLCAKTFTTNGGHILDAVIGLWKMVMRNKFPGGPQEMFQIYFPDKSGIKHPFVVAAPKEWS